MAQIKVGDLRRTNNDSRLNEVQCIYDWRNQLVRFAGYKHGYLTFRRADRTSGFKLKLTADEAAEVLESVEVSG